MNAFNAEGKRALGESPANFMKVASDAYKNLEVDERNRLQTTTSHKVKVMSSKDIKRNGGRIFQSMQKKVHKFCKRKLYLVINDGITKFFDLVIDDGIKFLDLVINDGIRFLELVINDSIRFLDLVIIIGSWFIVINDGIRFLVLVINDGIRFLELVGQ